MDKLSYCLNQLHKFLFFSFIFFMTGCENDVYLFDSSPSSTKNNQAYDRLSSMGVTAGVYAINHIINDSGYKKESFQSSDFDQYQPPVLGDEKDSILYIQNALSIGRLVEIQGNGKDMTFQHSCYISASVFDNYILRQQKRINFDDSSSLSAQIISDTLLIFNHTTKKDSIPTKLMTKIKCRKVGPIYITEAWLQKDDFKFDYLSLIDSVVYSVNKVEKDSTAKDNKDKPAYEIRQITATKETITCKELTYSSDSITQFKNDSTLVSIGFKHNGWLIGYKEADIAKLFDSPIATVKFELLKIHNFPTDDSSNLVKKILFVIGSAILLGILVFFIRRNRKSKQEN